MYPDERSALEEAFLYLQQAVEGTLSNTAPPVRQEHVEAIVSLLQRWPAGSRFPRAFISRSTRPHSILMLYLGATQSSICADW